MGGGALGAQLTPLVAEWSGSWHASLAWLSVPTWLALLTACKALPQSERPAGFRSMSSTFTLLRRPRTWLLMACFGLVNGGYTSLVAWLAPYYQTLGWSQAGSGGLVALMALGQAAAALSLPALAAGHRDRRPWLWLTLMLQAISFIAIALWPELAPRAWVVIAGAGLGGCFALCLVVALDHLPDPEQAGALSALMQGGGFLIAALAPWVAATLHDWTGGFVAGWLAQFACIIIVFGLTARLAPGRYAAAMAMPTRETSRRNGGYFPQGRASSPNP
jgi:CP family cyanate transporter-like MFS transporter